ncbi:fungal-specific transcription factor domain-containing protein [Lentinula aciculospora]|uniref:Fungal-specific transcription factor domain-containing protein n=1 Tax=Lentinula aciculospora TaxID=153920 RepID=A0A9W9AUM9_9AGAR|nr:fungal-specific transcription factor domain-containing protein [Lentinula aciculospora]
MLYGDSEPRQEHKKPRLPNACKNCRQKRIKCDSAIRPGNICSNCIAHQIECSHEVAKKRGPRIGYPRGQRSIQATVDAILSTRRPFEVPKDPLIVKGILVDLANHIQELEEDIARLRHASPPIPSSSQGDTPPMTQLQSNQEEGIIVSSENSSRTPDNYSVDDLTFHLKMFEFDDDSVRHFGSSSSRTLVKAALDIKKEYTGETDLVETRLRPSFKRPEFWSIQPWQKIKVVYPPSPLQFPPDDLMTDLIDLFFTQLSPLWPILHRPSFLRCIEKRLHREDYFFGSLVLAVCALGARFSHDPRIFEERTSPERSIGWQWIRQIQPIKFSYNEPPSIYEIQMYLVYIMFVATTSTPEVCWILISIAVRLLQDVGAHRKRPDNSKPTLETELWNRAFWITYSLDILTSTMLGRPRCMSQNDCDADMPLECDDEYWEHADPKQAFQQPPGKPSSMSFWICFLKLINILSLTLHTIHAVKQSNMPAATLGLSKQEWTEKIITELDSLLNEWTDEIPSHLKWKPDRENIQHFDQSVVLYTTYYWTQIIVHRPFIPLPGVEPQSSIPSLAICANAARSCLHVIEIQQQRKTNALVVPNVTIALFNCAIVILVNIWRGKHVGSSSSDPNKELADVHRAIDALHLYEDRWEQAARSADILMEVISVSHFQQSSQSRSSLKRPRTEDDDLQPASVSPRAVDKEKRRTAGSNRVLTAIDITKTHHLPTMQESTTKFTLPLNSNELGSLPIYEPFNWSWPQDQWLLPSGDQNLNNPWAAAGTSDGTQFGFYSASSAPFTNFSTAGVYLNNHPFPD